MALRSCVRPPKQSRQIERFAPTEAVFQERQQPACHVGSSAAAAWHEDQFGWTRKLVTGGASGPRRCFPFGKRACNRRCPNPDRELVGSFPAGPRHLTFLGSLRPWRRTQGGSISMPQDFVGAAGNLELRSRVPRLTDLQWQVICLAVRECPGKIGTCWGARLQNLLHRHFGARLGWRARQPLANECLEACGSMSA